jgi:hypothetical protein
MSRYWAKVALLAAVGALVTVALAAGTQQQAAPQPARPHAGVGRHGLGGPGLGFWMGRGYIEPKPEARQLWDQLGKLQADRHEAQWQLFVLLAQSPQDSQKIQAQQQKLAGLDQQIRQLWRQLHRYWHPLPAGAAGRAQGKGVRARVAQGQVQPKAVRGGTPQGQVRAPGPQAARPQGQGQAAAGRARK